MNYDMTYLDPSELEADQVGLLVSLLIRFPQIGSVRYDPESNIINLTFVIRSNNRDEQHRFEKELRHYLDAFYELVNARPRTIEFSFLPEGGLSLFSIKRDLFSLSRQEINLIVSLVQNGYADKLLTEGPEASEEEKEVQDGFLEGVLTAKTSPRTGALIGYREQGRVFVFSQSETSERI